jgi:mannose-6-phosphate isomerase-like protein (cupin superfamily)
MTEKRRETHEIEPHIKTSIELLNGYVNTEKRQSQVLRIVSGEAWVTMDGEDFALKEGDELKLSHGADKALISSADNSPLVYQFEE